MTPTSVMLEAGIKDAYVEMSWGLCIGKNPTRKT